MKKEKCFEIGTMQAFIDGELTSDVTENVIKHIALCDTCAMLLAETEEENAFAFAVLDEELNCLVPTERLRTKVFDSIREIESKESWWHKLTAGLLPANGFNFRSPSLVAFASVVLFVCTLAIGLKMFQPMPSKGDVVVKGGAEIEPFDGRFIQSIGKNKTDSPDMKETDKSNEIPAQKPRNTGGFAVIQTGGLKTQKDDRKIKPQNPKPPKVESGENTEPPASPNLSGEDSYLQTIATLSRTVDNSKDMVLAPGERVEFERDLAVVNDAIKKMKTEVRKNPNNQAAREVLRASYQNKIDLLNSVAEKNELMASIQ